MASHYTYERTAGRDEVAALLSVLADELAAGTVRFGHGAETVAIAVPDEVDLELEFGTEDGEVEVEIEMEWAGTDLDAIAAAIDALADADERVDEPPISPAAQPDRQARFEVFRDRGDEWRWRLVHRNGNILATGAEGHTQKHNALKGLRSVKRNAPLAEIDTDSSK